MGRRRNFQRNVCPLGEATVEGVIHHARGKVDYDGKAYVVFNDVTITYADTGKTLVRDSITCTGFPVSEYKVGKQCICRGEIVSHPRYGNQLKVSFTLPSIAAVDTSDIKTYDDLVGYIVNQKIKNIGEGIARNIVNAFDSFEAARDVVMLHPNKLYDMNIDGVGSTRIDRFVNYMAKGADERRSYFARKTLTDCGITDSMLDKLTREYGGDVVSVYEIVKDNPYVLTSIRGINFKTADDIAAAFGIVDDDSRRLRAAINFAIVEFYCGRRGNTLVTQELIINKIQNYLPLSDGKYVDEQSIRQSIQSLIDDHELATDRDDINSANRWLQPVKYFSQEHDIIESVHIMLDENNQSLVSSEKLEKLIDAQQIEFKYAKGYRLNDSQLAAVRLPFTNCLSLFTGGAGTGKTSTVAMITRIADELHIPYVLCAPTGKAAKRMRDTCLDKSSGGDAFTIHKMLGIYSDKDRIPQFKNAKLVICDEASMLDTYVASELFTACSESDVPKHLLLTGDVNQLPSISPGAVFSNLLNYPGVATTRLETSYRQADGSPILDAAEGVLNRLSPCREELNLEFYACDDDNVTETITKNVLPIINREDLWFYNGRNIVARDIVAFLSPKNEGPGSVDCLNDYLRPIYNDKFKDAGKRNFLLQEGDFVVQTSNVYAGHRSDNGEFLANHMNGDQAIIEKIGYKKGNKYYVVHFLDDKFEEEHKRYEEYEEIYSEAEAKEYLKLAYATTIHKYQGSQCHTAVIVMMDNFSWFLTKNLLYTALTRATDRVILVGSRKAFNKAAVTESRKRFTGIRESLHLR